MGGTYCIFHLYKVTEVNINKRGSLIAWAKGMRNVLGYGNILYLSLGDGYVTVCIWYLNECILLYVNYTSVKSFQSLKNFWNGKTET